MNEKIRKILDRMEKEETEHTELMQGGWTKYPEFKIEGDKVIATRQWHTERPFQSGETKDILKIIKDAKGKITTLELEEPGIE